MCVHRTVHNIIVAHNITQNRPDSFSRYPADDHHSSDDVYLREEGTPKTSQYSNALVGNSLPEDLFVSSLTVAAFARHSKACFLPDLAQMRTLFCALHLCSIFLIFLLVVIAADKTVRDVA